VYPFQVHLYEIFNPGAVVRIWAGDCHNKWVILWEGAAQTVRPAARIFSPPLHTINFTTRYITPPLCRALILIHLNNS